MTPEERAAQAQREMHHMVSTLRAVDPGRPGANYREPFWHLVHCVETLADSFPDKGIAEALMSALTHLKYEDQAGHHGPVVNPYADVSL